MSGEAAFLYARTSYENGWELEDKVSYNARALREEYRRMLYSDRGLEVLKCRQESRDHSREAAEISAGAQRR